MVVGRENKRPRNKTTDLNLKESGSDWNCGSVKQWGPTSDHILYEYDILLLQKMLPEILLLHLLLQSDERKLELAGNYDQNSHAT